jgi:hypothetical protein
MKKIIRLTESELNSLIRSSVKRILREDVLGNDWRENEDAVYNNYEPFESQQDMEREEMENQHDWSTQGEDTLDNTDYGDEQDYDPDLYTDDAMTFDRIR